LGFFSGENLAPCAPAQPHPIALPWRLLVFEGRIGVPETGFSNLIFEKYGIGREIKAIFMARVSILSNPGKSATLSQEPLSLSGRPKKV
jgi:hypothetical protein